MILILRRFRGGPVEGFMGGASLETFSGEASLETFTGEAQLKNTLYNVHTDRKPPPHTSTVLSVPSSEG